MYFHNKIISDHINFTILPPPHPLMLYATFGLNDFREEAKMFIGPTYTGD